MTAIGPAQARQALRAANTQMTTAGKASIAISVAAVAASARDNGNQRAEAIATAAAAP
ncbi:hypothetical protein [Flavisphingomonas formosensis]|uniref:hypothetical protein n=1 Tax=Flavisphingomonas formosensis TaxID=861534 RepID=UPI0012FBE169|nr:hypothetical protein [Sphingomonas formosensis]